MNNQVEKINKKYSPKELGCIVEKNWLWCGFPQPISGSFEMRATKITEKGVLLEGHLRDSVDLLLYGTIHLVPLKELMS